MITRDSVSTWKVLIVDDEPDSLEVAARVLKFHGATVYLAANGLEGLEKARQIELTFILSDISMPQMDGWEMRYELENDPRTMAIPVVALTAHGMPGDRERAIAAGFQYYLTKPLSPITLLDDLLKLFDDHKHAPTIGIAAPTTRDSLGSDLAPRGSDFAG